MQRRLKTRHPAPPQRRLKTRNPAPPIPASFRENPFFYLLATYQTEFGAGAMSTGRFTNLQPQPTKIRFEIFGALPPALQAQAHNEPGFTRVGWVVAVDATDAPQYLVGHVRIFATQPQPADFANAQAGLALVNTNVTHSIALVVPQTAGNTGVRNSFRVSS